jgi:hypothetical protein
VLKAADETFTQSPEPGAEAAVETPPETPPVEPEPTPAVAPSDEGGPTILTPE